MSIYIGIIFPIGYGWTSVFSSIGRRCIFLKYFSHYYSIFGIYIGSSYPINEIWRLV